MKQTLSRICILGALVAGHLFTACKKTEIDDTKNSEITIGDSIIQDTVTAGVAKPISYWVYDDAKELPVESGIVPAAIAKPEALIGYINSKGDGKIMMDFQKVSNDTIYVEIKKSTFLTQQAGSMGADAFMSATTFTLTELEGIDYVNFDFKEGDHATPGVYTREYYIAKNKATIK